MCSQAVETVVIGLLVVGLFEWQRWRPAPNQKPLPLGLP